MLLAEAIIEKEYIEESIDKVNDYIYNLLRYSDRAKLSEGIIEKELKGLNNLYREYQRFDISISRAESQAKVKINDTEVSLRDCRLMKGAMDQKLSNFENILESLQNRGLGDVICDVIMAGIEEMRVDIKTIDTKIQYALWNTEVK